MNVLADKVLGWLANLPLWQRDLARRLAGQTELDEEEYAEALCVVKAQFGAPCDGPTPAVRPIGPGDLPAGSVGGTTRLRGLGSAQGVGLLGEDEELKFGPSGLTLIYGANAVGKSSYVRTIKKLCRTIDRDCHVRGSIYAKTPTPAPSVKIEYEIGGIVTARRTTLVGTPDVQLPGVSVFDVACVELYVDAHNTVQYVPGELRLLARLAAHQDRMRRDLATDLSELRRGEPSRDGYPPTTEVARALARLTGTDSDPDLAALAAVTDHERARIVELRGVVAAAAASTAKDDARAAQREAGEATALADALTSLAARTSETAAVHLRQAAEADTKARAAVLLAAEQLAGPVPGVGGEPWRLLWDAARQFVASFDGTFPPGAGEPCPLCLQSVTADTATQMAHFEAHVSSTVQATAAEATATLTEALAECAPEHASSCRTPLLETLRDREPGLAGQVDAVIAAVEAHLVVMQANPAAATSKIVDVAPVATALRAWRDARNARAASLLSAEDPEKLAQVKTELAELEARERLAGELDAFELWRKRLQTIKALDNAHSGLATNRITTAQRELTETVVGKALDAALTEELKRLSCTHLPVELHTKTAVAETKVSLKLLAHDPVKVSEVVSEGERRALALSFFFAELAVTNDDSGIVLDDPVSSLDEERRRYIADRLVAEAGRRQVIVFTHDLAFLLDLQDQAAEAGVSLTTQGVWRQGDDVGRVSDDLPFKAMKLRERLGKLKQRVAGWDAQPRPADQDEAWRRVTAFYSDLRTAWERAVEERLFQGVVQRFQRGVKTQALKDVQVTEELVRQVNEGMTRTSMFLHDQAPGAAVPLPGRTDLAADLELLDKFAKDVPVK